MSPRPVHLYSLGSSFAAGPGIFPQSNASASRSALNYPSVLASHLGATHTDLSVSGATLLNLSSEAQDSFAPQVEGIPYASAARPEELTEKAGTIRAAGDEPKQPEQTENSQGERVIVTLTAGGNDIDYIGQLSTEGYNYYPPFMWFTAPSIASPSIPEADLKDRLELVIRRIRERQPGATVLIVQYLTILGDHAQPGVTVPLTAPQVEALRAMAELMGRVNAEVARAHEGVHVVPVARRSTGHGVGSPEAWVSGHRWFARFGGEPAWHPNKAGMQGVAAICLEHLRGLGIA